MITKKFTLSRQLSARPSISGGEKISRKRTIL
jgi:hypothetical protein